MTIPYTYLLKFLPTGQYYYGVRFAEHCYPSELFTTYFSSSRIIGRLIAEYGTSAFEFQIRRTFNNKISARDWEQKLLIKVNAASNPTFLNQSNNMKGIMRLIGTYSWYYNPITLEKLLLKNSSPTPIDFIKGKRGPDKKQAGTVVAYNINTGKQKKFASIKDITGDWVHGRPGGTTSGTKWICNDITGETKLLIDGDNLPAGWRMGNKNIKNKNRIKITRSSICKSIYPNELEEFLNNGWILGNTKSQYVKIFRIINNICETNQIHPADYDTYKSAGWFKGEPILYKIYFSDGRVLIHPYQWFVANMGISKDMILYAAASGGKSPKFKFDKVERII